MLTNREMVNFQKWDFIRFFFIPLLLIVLLQEHKKMPLSICFALFVAKILPIDKSKQLLRSINNTSGVLNGKDN